MNSGRIACGAGRYGRGMLCPSCAADETKVVDSRSADDGGSIRRRRECGGCHHRFTTFERVEELPLMVLKRSGARVPFDRSTIVGGVRAAAKGRPIDDDALQALSCRVEEGVRLLGSEVTSEQIGRQVLDELRHVDEVAALRFASVYKGFTQAADFERELRLIKKDLADSSSSAPSSL